MAFHVFRNKTHVTVVNDEDIIVGVEDDHAEYSAALAKAALERAREKFEEAGLDTDSLFLAGKVDSEGGSVGGDDPVQGLVGEEAFIDTARAIAHGDVSFDSDAVVSGYNLQGWVPIDPAEMYQELSEEPPVQFERSSPDRDEDLRQISDAAEAVNRLVDDSIFSADPEHQGQVAALKDAIARLRQVCKPARPAITQVIQTWEVSEGVASEFTPEQKQPWKLEAEMTALDQLCVDLKPARDARKWAPGLSVWIEVDEGVPTVHIGANGHDNLVHVRGFGEELEITPAEANTFHFGEKSRREGVDYCIVAKSA